MDLSRHPGRAHTSPRAVAGLVRVPAQPPRIRLLLEHGAAFVSDQQVVHVVGVLLFLGQDALEEHAGGRVLVAEIAHHLAIGLDGDALGDEVFFDHLDQVGAFDILRGGALAEAIGVQIGLAAELVDALGQHVQVLALLFGVLRELLLYGLAGQAGGADRVKLVAEDTHDFGGYRVVEQGDRVLHLAPVVLGDGAIAQMTPGPLSDLLDVVQKRTWSAHDPVPFLPVRQRSLAPPAENSATCCRKIISNAPARAADQGPGTLTPYHDSRKCLICDTARIVSLMSVASSGNACDDVLAITISCSRSTNKFWP